MSIYEVSFGATVIVMVEAGDKDEARSEAENRARELYEKTDVHIDNFSDVSKVA